MTKDQDKPATLKEIEQLLSTNTLSINKHIKDEIASFKTTFENKFKEFEERVTHVEESAEFISNEFETNKRNIKQLKDEVKKLDTHVKNLQSQISSVSSGKTCDDFKERIQQVEIFSKRNNLIFYGVKSEQNEMLKTSIHKIFELMKVDPDIELSKCFKMSQSSEDPLPVMVVFKSFDDREHVWNKRRELRNTNVIVNEDFPPDVLDERNILLPVYKYMLSLGKRCLLKGSKLIIESRTYTTTTLPCLYAEYPNANPELRAGRDFGNIFGFYSRFSPFSNFYKAKFTINGKTFHSTEQMFQAEKCCYAGYPGLAERIMLMDDPAKCKREAKKMFVLTDDQNRGWKNHSLAVMKEAITAKFHQNPVLMKKLLDTKPKILAEMSFDRVWGTGLQLSNDANNDPAKWTGSNNLGSILMQVRDEQIG